MSGIEKNGIVNIRPFYALLLNPGTGGVALSVMRI